MKHIFGKIICLFLCASMAYGCKPYDDSLLWKGIDAAQKQVAELTASLDKLSREIVLLKELASGGAINSITANPAGGYTVNFTTASGDRKTAVIAAASDVVTTEMIGMKESDGILCWTITSGGRTSFLTDVDGAKIPVSGRTPSITVDKSGYWMVNGEYVYDSNGNKVKSSGTTVSLITGLVISDEGTAVFTFGDGSNFTANTTESLCIKACINGEPVTSEYNIEEGVGSLTVTYELKGRLAGGAIVTISRIDGIAAALDTMNRSVAVTISQPETFVAGGFILTATAADGTMAVRPIYFSGSSDVELDNDLWKVVDKETLAPGCTYFAMEFKKTTRKMKVLEVTLTSPVLLTTSYANDCVPNPNGNNNDNNGFCIRETLSQLCARKRTEGQDVLGGVNTGFFDSNDGISRGAHIEEGQFAYMPNPRISDGLVNHSWGFAVFKDNTAAVGKKAFTGKVKIAGVEKRFYSVNDTILRGRDEAFLKSYPVNIYTSKYKKTPHSKYTKLTNSLSANALYIVAKLSSGSLDVNEGWKDASVTKVVKGSVEQPYLTAADEVAVQIFATDTAGLSSVKAGDAISLRSDMTMDGVSKPIYTLNSTMWQFITNGENTVGTIPVSHGFRTDQDPMTFVTVNKSAKRICLIQIDGRRTAYSIGVNADECAEIALHLGAWNSTRFDGGGSSSMWIYRGGSGSTVSSPCDSKGERSCLNYIYIRKK